MAMRKVRGFTLVELLVVIGIYRQLADRDSLAGRCKQQARRSALQVQCASNMRQLGSGFMLYGNDNKGYILPADLPWAYNTGDPTRWQVELILGKYLAGQGSLYSVTSGNQGNAIYFNGNGQGVFQCPADEGWRNTDPRS